MIRCEIKKTIGILLLEASRAFVVRRINGSLVSAKQTFLTKTILSVVSFVSHSLL